MPTLVDSGAIHFCKENPCSVQDAEIFRMLTNGYNTAHMTNSVLEQFNEEVKDKFHELFPE